MLEKFVEKLNGVPAYLRDWINTFRGKLTIACLIGLILLPLANPGPYIIGIFATFMIYTIFAASWDFLAGYTGQVSFGQASFFGFAAYVTADRLLIQNWSWLPSLLYGDNNASNSASNWNCLNS